MNISAKTILDNINPAPTNATEFTTTLIAGTVVGLSLMAVLDFYHKNIAKPQSPFYTEE